MQETRCGRAKIVISQHIKHKQKTIGLYFLLPIVKAEREFGALIEAPIAFLLSGGSLLF